VSAKHYYCAMIGCHEFKTYQKGEERGIGKWHLIEFLRRFITLLGG
jgi:hypothetical protein